MMNESFVSEAPARICFFGEHQDYLGLPVISCAVPLHCRIDVNVAKASRIITLTIPQLNDVRAYNLDALPPRQKSTTQSPDFALAAIHETLDDGWDLCGAECTSRTHFPMNAGISSSSAFCVAFCHALAQIAGKTPMDPMNVAKLAHRAEVSHFQAPGGTMDHVSSAVGGMLRIGPGLWDVQRLNVQPSRGVWVLAYSGEPKDTLKHLHRCKSVRLALLDKLGGTWDHCDVSTLSMDEQELLDATQINRNTEIQAWTIWETASGPELASLMQRHHEALRDGLHLSSPRLEAMNQAARKAGAWGFKVVGSGGGGCGVAWTSEDTALSVAEALKSVGAAETWIVKEPTTGAKLYAK